MCRTVVGTGLSSCVRYESFSSPGASVYTVLVVQRSSYLAMYDPALFLQLRPHQPLQPVPQSMLHPQRTRSQHHRTPSHRPRQQDPAALPRENLPDNPLRHTLGIQQRIQPRILRREVANERRPREALRNQHRPHRRRVVPSRQLRREPLVEGQRRRLGSRVVDHVGRGREPALRGHRDHHAVVGRRERGDEFAREVIVRESVDFEQQSGLRFAAAQDRAAGAKPRVVDEDRRRAQCAADRVRCVCNGRGRRDVALVVVNLPSVFRRRVRWRLDIQHRNSNPPSGELERDLSADAVTPARQHDDFPCPVVPVCDAIVHRAPVQPCVHAPDDGQEG